MSSLFNNIPDCLIIPASNGSLSNCITLKMPSINLIILLLIISWIIYLFVAYAIYYFINTYSTTTKVNYWIILAILILSGLIVNLFF